MSRSGNSRKKNNASRKLSSERGASITFALLLFLVCAALSAVILVAATTASGRMSSISQTDQRYYSVTSAAVAIRDMLSDGTVTVLTVNDVEHTFNKPINQIRNSDIYESMDSVDNVADESAGDDPKAGKAGGKVTLSSLSTYLASQCAAAATEKAVQKSVLTLSSDITNDPLLVDIDVSAQPDGKVNLTVHNQGNDQYKMLLVFSSVTRAENPPVTNSEKYTITGAAEVSWELDKMVSAYDAG